MNGWYSPRGDTMIRQAVGRPLIHSCLALLVGVAPGAVAQPPRGRGPGAPADQPAARADRNSQTAHAQLLEKAKAGRIDVYFVGDSITRRWGATDYPELLAN